MAIPANLVRTGLALLAGIVTANVARSISDKKKIIAKHDQIQPRKVFTNGRSFYSVTIGEDEDFETVEDYESWMDRVKKQHPGATFYGTIVKQNKPNQK